jgi:hypothetical protein
MTNVCQQVSSRTVVRVVSEQWTKASSGIRGILGFFKEALWTIALTLHYLNTADDFTLLKHSWQRTTDVKISSPTNCNRKHPTLSHLWWWVLQRVSGVGRECAVYPFIIEKDLQVASDDKTWLLRIYTEKRRAMPWQRSSLPVRSTNGRKHTTYSVRIGRSGGCISREPLKRQGPVWFEAF